jgi:hypothetical protein
VDLEKGRDERKEGKGIKEYRKECEGRNVKEGM